MAPILSEFDEVNKIVSGYPVLYYKIDSSNNVLDCLYGDFQHEGTDMQDVIGKPLDQVIPSSLKEYVEVSIKRIRQGEKTSEEVFLAALSETVYQCSAKYIPLVDGEIILIFKLISLDSRLDLTSFNQIKYSGMLELCPNMISIIDFENCRVLEANDIFLNFFQMDWNSIKDRSIHDLVTEDYHEVLDNITECLRNNQVIKNLYLEVYGADRQKRLIEVNLIGIYEGDRICYTLCVAKDVQTESQVDDMKEMFVENMRLMSEVVEFDKIRTEFFSNISHDFKTPINVLLGALKLMELNLQKMDDEDEVKAKMQRLHGSMRINCYRLLRLVSNLLDLTKIEAGKIQINYMNCDFIKLTRGITASIKDYAIGKRVHLLYESELKEKLLRCDPEKIERILLNLLSNAIKFTRVNDTITVSVKEVGEEIILSVRDTGLGIKPEDQKQIFERFKQVDQQFNRNTTGSGIGLSLVQSLVDMHEGRIWFASEYGNGTEFFIALPNKITEQRAQYYNGYDEFNDGERVVMEFSDIYLA